MGKASNNDKSFEVEQLKLNARIENFMDQNSNIDHGQFFITPEPLKSTRKFLPLGGGVLDGSIGYNPSKITISSGAIDIGKDSDQYSGFVILTSESGTTDTLTDINNFLLSYQSLKLQAASGHTITITTTGNIDLSSSISLTNQDTIELFFDIVDNTWKLMGSSGNGSDEVFTWTADHSAATFDLTNLDRLLFSQTAGESLASTDTGITSDAAGNLALNIPTSANYSFTVADGASPPLTIAATLLTTQTIIPVGTDTLGILAIPWSAGFINDITLGGAGTSIDKIGKVIFDQTAGNIATAANIEVFGDLAGNMNLNVPTGQQFNFTVAAGATAALSITSTAVTCQSLFPVGTDTLGVSGVEWSAAHINDITLGGAGTSIDSVGKVIFDASAGNTSVAANIEVFGDVSGNMNFNIPTSANYSFDIAASGTAALTVAAGLISAETIIPVGTDTLGILAIPWSVAYVDNIVLSNDITPSVTGTSLLGTTALAFNSLSLTNSLNFGTGGIRKISLSSSNILIQSSTGNDIEFKENGTTFFICDGGLNAITISRPVQLGANLLSNTANITPTTTTTYDLGTTSLLYQNLYAEKMIFDTNTQVTLGTFGVSIFANNTGDDIFLTADDTLFAQANSSGSLGFFGTATSSTKVTPASDTLANLYTALRAYNLIG